MTTTTTPPLLTVTERDGVVSFTVRVAPRSSREAIVGVHDGALRVALTAAPVDGQANEALVAFMARRLGVPKRSIAIVHGATGRTKVLAVRGTTADAVRALAAG